MQVSKLPKVVSKGGWPVSNGNVTLDGWGSMDPMSNPVPLFLGRSHIPDSIDESSDSFCIGVLKSGRD